jgi:MYXO-CTERM domain-containing protein
MSRRIIPAAVLLAASLLTVSAEAGPVVINSLVSGKMHDKFTSTFSVNNLVDFVGGDFVLSFDSTLLALVGVERGSLTMGPDFSDPGFGPPVLGDVIVSLIYGGGTSVSGDGSLFSALFEFVADTTSPVSLTLSFDNTDFGYTVGDTQVVVKDTTPTDPTAVPITNTAALAALALAALGFTRRKALTRQA